MTKPSWQDFATHDESAFPELWDGVVGAWAPCLGPTGSRLHDMSRRSNWGTLTNMDNATDWAVSNGQYALDFDGSNDYVTTGVAVPTSQMTFAVWARPSDVGLYRRPCGDADSNSGTRGTSLIFFAAGRLYWVLRGGTATDLDVTGLAWSLNDWVHVVCSLGSAPRMIVNGRLVGTGTGTTFANWVSDWKMGTDDTTRFGFAGQVDDHTIWRRALSVEEASFLYQIGRGGMYQRRRRRAIYLPQAGFQSAWARGSNVLLGFNQP